MQLMQILNAFTRQAIALVALAAAGRSSQLSPVQQLPLGAPQVLSTENYVVNGDFSRGLSFWDVGSFGPIGELKEVEGRGKVLNFQLPLNQSQRSLASYSCLQLNPSHSNYRFRFDFQLVAEEAKGQLVQVGASFPVGDIVKFFEIPDNTSWITWSNSIPLGTDGSSNFTISVTYALSAFELNLGNFTLVEADPF